MKERELLQRVLGGDNDGYFFISHELLKEIQDFLAQPEQEPVVWQVIGIAGFMYLYNKPIDQVYLTHTVNALYTAPPKREPLGLEIMDACGSEDYREGFKDGALYAEKCHGIGGE